MSATEYIDLFHNFFTSRKVACPSWSGHVHSFYSCSFIHLSTPSFIHSTNMCQLWSSCWGSSIEKITSLLSDSWGRTEEKVNRYICHVVGWPRKGKEVSGVKGDREGKRGDFLGDLLPLMEGMQIPQRGGTWSSQGAAVWVGVTLQWAHVCRAQGPTWRPWRPQPRVITLIIYVLNLPWYKIIVVWGLDTLWQPRGNFRAGD